MRIAQVIEEVGISKKAIHHYIHIGLIAPACEPKNGYYDFAEKDVNALRAIQSLRELDCTLEEIRDILTWPQFSRFFLLRVLKRKTLQAQRMKNQCGGLQRLIDSLPYQNTAPHCALRSELPDCPAVGGRELDEIDAELLVCYFWGTFMQDVELTEYRRFLAQRLKNYILKQSDPALLTLRDHFYSISSRQVSSMLTGQKRNIERIASLPKDSIPTMVREMAALLQSKLADRDFFREWERHRESFYVPAWRFYSDAHILQILEEFGGCFQLYANNMNACYRELESYLNTPEGAPLQQQLHSALHGWSSQQENPNYLAVLLVCQQ